MTENKEPSQPKIAIAGDKSYKKNQRFLKLVFVLLVIFFLAFAFYKLVYVRYKTDNKETVAKEVSKNIDEKKNFTLPPPPSKQFNIVNNKAEVEEEDDVGFIGNKNANSNSTGAFSKSSGTMVVKSGQSNSASQSQSDNQSSGNNDGNKIGSSSNDMFSSTAFKANTAIKSRYNPNLLLEQGTYIPCVLRQKLISNVGGQISCTIAENVLSKNGNVTLIEKGSKAVGVYQTGAVSHGSDQIFVIWQEIRTPNNINVDVNSGSTDELGANGLTGWTDQHFWKRFGNAILLSMITDSSSALSSRLAKSDNRNYLENTQENSEELAKTVLEQMGDIKPTLYKNQGDKVGIFVARDIDFSSVYSLNKRGQ
ncbi:type IV secretion system protein VirB10 [Gilliamella sp. Bif1-4]|uniref:type IV secretion system protein VirB10 n=1 Tax=Gilliamella sp. Bif1-4 TaxID=3120233 RepID=UPI00080E1930|nr:type IV secretion system protein VirB10 [Gilliamella apicola]OCG40856.1 hypothetical protein A9G25_06860 [Gilliamella apicola]